MTIQWRAGSSHQLPGALSRLLRPGLAADPVDDSVPDDATSGEPDAYVRPQGPVLNGLPLRELEPSKEGVVDPGGMREKRVAITPHATGSCSQEPRTPRPRPPPAPSLLGGVVDSIPQTRRGAVLLPTSVEEGLTDRQLGTLAFYDRLATVGVGTLAVALRRSTRASAPSVRLRRPCGFVCSPTTWLAKSGHLGRARPLRSARRRRVRRPRGWSGSVQGEAAVKRSRPHQRWRQRVVE